MPGLPWYLLPVWPLIFWRIQRLKAWFKAAGGPGSEMLWGVAWNGRVMVVHLTDDLSGPHPACFRAPVSDRPRPPPSAPSGAARVAPYSNSRADLP